MKKFLVLSLVLGIASLATAGLSLNVAGNEALTADQDGLIVNSDGSIVISGALATAETQYTIKFEVAGGLTIDTGSLDLPAAGWAFGNTISAPVPATNTDPLILSGGAFPASPAGTVAFTGLGIDGEGTLTITETIVLPDFSEQNIVSTVSIVPEPATMALLGLGALVLRRRK